jgi:transposase-like protein
MSKRQRVALNAVLLLAVAVAGAFWAEWRYLSGQLQCPHCGAFGTYKATVRDGQQVISCKTCAKEFTIEVRNGRFAGRPRRLPEE